MSAKQIANEGLYMKYVEEIALRGRLSDYSAFYFNIEGLTKISEEYGFLESRKVGEKYSQYLLDFIENDEFVAFLGSNNYCALIKKNRTNTFRHSISSLDIDTVNHGRIITHHLEAVSGIWEINEQVHDINDIINNPALAFIEAKYIVGGQYMTLPDGTVSRTNQKREVVEALQDAIKDHEFEVYYQPKVDVTTNTLVGAEGLVRWHRNGEVVSPGIFIRPFEQTGDILQLDYHVLRMICADISDWTKRGIAPVPISANYSRKNLLDEDLAENIAYIIEKSGIDKKYIELEIAETHDSEEYSFMNEFVSDLTERGIPIAVDNFGSGYRSLLTIKNMPIKTIKIDRSFINKDDFSHTDEVLLSELVNIANKLGIAVITQGVEREDQLAFVKGVGCNVVQGYYFDRPLPKAKFEEKLSNRNYQLS